MKVFPNILLIGGAGRKVGKTLLACNLIRHFASEMNITAIKISPHMHNQPDMADIIQTSPSFLILKENNPDSHKDSARMLKSGAAEVFYIQATDNFLTEATDILLQFHIKDKPVICESAGLRKYVKPGLFFYVTSTENSSSDKNNDLKDLADIRISLTNNFAGFDPDKLAYVDNRWLFKNSEL